MYKLYNGCPNRELKDKWDMEAKAEKELDELCLSLRGVGAFVTYFPMEGKYAVSDKNYKSIGEFENTIEEACRKAINILQTE